MWVEELKNGKYKFVERYTDPMTGKSKRVAVVMDKNTAKNRKMAALTLSDKIESALAPQVDRIRLKDLVELYRKEQVKTLKQSTYRRNIAVCNTLMSILGKDIYVDKLTAGYIRERFLGTGREHSTLNEWMIRLKALLRWGYKNDYIADISYLGKIERLYTSGDELVEVIFEILEKMLGCNLSGFIDKKKEDFNFKIKDKVFIGEIKGVTPNVKKLNVSQLDVHVQEYLDDNEEENQNIVALLIINHQRNKPITEREKVNEEVIKLAKRNGSLIVETMTILRLFEQYLSKEKTREECIDILVNHTGLLEI